jgi:hypothetical protein
MIIGMGQAAGFSEVPEAMFMRNMLAGFMSTMLIAGFVSVCGLPFASSCAAALRIVNDAKRSPTHNLVDTRKMI